MKCGLRIPLAFASLIAVAVRADNGSTLIDNGDFRKFTAGGRVTCWKYSSHSWHALEGVGVSGSRALVCDNSSAEEAGTARQFFAMTPGGRYVIEAEVFAEGEADGGRDAGAYARVEWTDADGNHLGGVTAGPALPAAGGWRHLCATSAVVRAGTVSGRMELGVTQGYRGRIVFDNVRFGRWRPEHLQDFVCSAKDGTAGEGTVEFRVQLDLSDENIAAWRGSFCWRGADGRTHVDVPKTMSATSASISLPVGNLAFGRSTVAFVLFKPNGEIAGRRELTFVRTL